MINSLHKHIHHQMNNKIKFQLHNFNIILYKEIQVYLKLVLQRVNFNPSLNFLYFHVVNMMMIIYDLIKYKILVDTN